MSSSISDICSTSSLERRILLGKNMTDMRKKMFDKIESVSSAETLKFFR